MKVEEEFQFHDVCSLNPETEGEETAEKISVSQEKKKIENFEEEKLLGDVASSTSEWQMGPGSEPRHSRHRELRWKVTQNRDRQEKCKSKMRIGMYLVQIR